MSARKDPVTPGGGCAYCGGTPAKGASVDPRYPICRSCADRAAAGLPLPEPGECPKCRGKGEAPCDICEGTPGERGCKVCHDTGREWCRKCRGQGRVYSVPGGAR